MNDYVIGVLLPTSTFTEEKTSKIPRIKMDT